MRGVRWSIRCAAVLALYASTARPALAAPCVGDCDHSGLVSVAELVRGVNIALGRRDVTDCPSFDLNDDSMVGINELIRGVRSALDGCEALETPTAIVTETPTGAVPTDTPGDGSTETPTGVGATDTPGAGTETPTAENTETPLATVSATVTPEVSATPADTETPVTSASETPTAEETSTPVATVSATVTPEMTATSDFSATPTSTPPAATETPSEATATVTTAPTETPTGIPTDTATAMISPSATPTPTGEVSTATQTPRIENVAGGSVVVANALGGIANVIAAAVTGVSGGGGAVLLGAGDFDFCELGGMIETTGGLPADVSITLTDCAVSRPNGSAVYDGTIALQDVRITVLPLGLTANATFAVSAEFKDIADTTTLTTKADLSAAIQLFVALAPGEDCTFSLPIGDVQVTGVDLTLSGDIESSTVGGGSSLVFDGTSAELAISAYQSDCVPSDYVLKLNGEAIASPVFPVATSGGGGPLAFALEFGDYTLKAQRDGETTDYGIDGTIKSECFGGEVVLETLMALRLADDELCPSEGQLAVTGVGVVTYKEGAVSIDDLDPKTATDEYGSCLDLSLLVCPS